MKSFDFGKELTRRFKDLLWAFALLPLFIIPFEYNNRQELNFVKTHAHVTATILESWSQSGRYGTHVYGRIKFTRQQGGQMITCEIDTKLGLPRDPLAAGNTLDIVPRLDSCEDPLITHRVLRTNGEWN